MTGIIPVPEGYVPFDQFLRENCPEVYEQRSSQPDWVPYVNKFHKMLLDRIETDQLTQPTENP